MLENIKGQKIELLPCKLKDNQIYCPTCGGIGWLRDTNAGCITICSNCNHGVINTCPTCGKPFPSRYSFSCNNPECVKKEVEIKNKHRKEKEKLILDKAEKIPFDGAFDRFTFLFSDIVHSNEGYFDDWDTFFDAFYEANQESLDCFGTPLERPVYVFGTDEVSISLNADSIIEDACNDLWEGAEENCDYKSLQTLLDDWCSEQSGTETYYVNYKYAVKIPWKLYDNK